MEQKLIHQIRVLQIYAGGLTLVLAGLIVFIFSESQRKNHFREIDAERINIVESDGRLRMVISNQKDQHPGTVDGKMVAPRERQAGMIFFNDDGDECGGLIFDGNKNEANMVYSIDQYRNDQIMQLQYAEDNSVAPRTRSYGLKMWDRSDDLTVGRLVRLDDSLRSLHDTATYKAAFRKMRANGLLGRERLFLGKTASQKVGLFIRDNKGRSRIEIGLDDKNNIVFHALDTSGHAAPFQSLK